jgi:hypothetical protein
MVTFSISIELFLNLAIWKILRFSLFPKFLIGFLYSHGRQTSRAYGQNEVVIDFELVPL